MSTQCTVCYGCQTICQTESQMALDQGAQLLPSVGRDDIIIKKINPAVLKAVADSITTAASQGDKKDSSPVTLPAITKEFMYASDINKFLDHITHGELVGSHPAHKSRDDIVYASFFTAINSAISALKVSPSACRVCNTSCNTAMYCCNCY